MIRSVLQSVTSPKKKCPRCTFDNDVRAKKCAMCNHPFQVKIRVSTLLKESTKLIRNPHDLQILLTLDRLFVESSHRCNMRGATPGRINLHLPSELHITPLPPHISNLPQPITCDVRLFVFYRSQLFSTQTTTTNTGEISTHQRRFII